MDNRRRDIGGRLAGGIIAVFVVAAALMGIKVVDLATTPPGDRPSGDRAQELREFQQLAFNHPNQALRQCEPSQPNLFSALAAHLSDDQDSFGDDRFEYRKNGLTYLSATLLNGNGDTRASTPVRVYASGGYAALDSAALRFSTFIPDATAQYQANNAQGVVATRVKTCVIAAGRAAAEADNG